ncbi:methylthioribulose 1-phosphate dehydratase [Oceanospirillum sp. HFRX-1_2]
MVDQATYAIKAQEVIEAGQFLFAEGWSPATSSNYSARIDAQNLAITVSGKHKGRLKAGDIMVVDLQGNPVQSTLKSSAETLLHCVLYDWRDDIGAVLHTHSVAATVLSRALVGEHALVLRDYELQKAFPGIDTHEGELRIPIFENTQNIDALSAESLAYLKQHPNTPAYLIRGHGLYTWGATMADTLRHIEAMEFLMACELKALSIGRGSF